MSLASLHSLHIQTKEGDAGQKNERLEDERMEASPKGEMSKEEGWIQIRNRKGKDLSTS